jgi:uncharacterized protein
MAPGPLHALRINARELLRVPGSSRTVEVDVDARELGVADDRIAGPIRVALTAVSNLDGVVVRGEIDVAWHSVCRRCLADVDGRAVVDVDEVYQDHVADTEAFAIGGDQVDLAPAVREYVLIELPDAPLCRSDCAGICPGCGADRNADLCNCDTAVRDDRWAVLDDLRLDE